MSLLKYLLFCFCIFSIMQLNVYSGYGQQQVGFYFNNPQKKITLPFELHNNLIIVKLSLNNTNPLNFIIDTGVRPTIFLDKSFADSIGMNYQREIDLYGVGSDEPLKGSVATGIKLSMDNLESANLSMLVLHENLLELEQHLGTRVYGILGYDLFSRFVIRINYQKKQLVLIESSEFRIPDNFDQIDLQLIDSKPVINLNIIQTNEMPIEAKLLVDTGASHALIINPLSDDSIIIPEQNIQANIGRSISGELAGKLGRVKLVEFGENSLKDVIASYIIEDPNGEEKNGSIGGELLRKFTVIFDYFHKKIYLKPNRFFKYPFEYNMSGLEFIAEGEGLGNYVIHNIRKGSAADGIGFMPGDRLVELNNLPEKKLTLSSINLELSEREGKEITLTVIREGSFISKSFLLKKEI